MEAYQWQAILTSDSSYDGQFFYGVVTTSIFCKPSCQSRTPKKEHVRIFGSPTAAIREGFRPCKRCQPDNPDWEVGKDLVREVHRLIASRYAEPLSLKKVAGEIRINPYHLHRTFKRWTGMTPAQALLCKRLSVARNQLLTTDKTITQIAQETGFATPSHFSAVFRRQVGQTPTAYRAGSIHSG
ncbi:bifunctional transcriptional activator/DNA repair enzyme AdaA [Desmospora profundinema]|uniref:AraC family transcriptional regulator of adaptative response / methylphosphotriester-DNA alkyltransferase methyltransferase n=1 Tax=Desmospora profundinema TaxID=1571184 RepID=A0ABU1IH44_9BACL|nr:Ada metal-binding domain-containing protein [Desmospora profundinema]MDR6224102.1 AraC family transcriptional regulator of adaptative response / methylphosphotriester-DNA alkyltransferase methyltransferase [Desmospora profundinema]